LGRLCLPKARKFAVVRELKPEEDRKQLKLVRK
jgi:hypothetical protein